MSFTVLNMSASRAAVESDTRPDVCSVQPTSDGRAVPERKRSAWDHCSPSTDSAFPHFDFHEENPTCTGDT